MYKHLPRQAVGSTALAEICLYWQTRYLLALFATSTGPMACRICAQGSQIVHSIIKQYKQCTQPVLLVASLYGVGPRINLGAIFRVLPMSQE